MQTSRAAVASNLNIERAANAEILAAFIKAFSRGCPKRMQRRLIAMRAHLAARIPPRNVVPMRKSGAREMPPNEAAGALDMLARAEEILRAPE